MNADKTNKAVITLQPAEKPLLSAKKQNAAKPPVPFSLPFWDPKRKWGTGQSPEYTDMEIKNTKTKSGKRRTFFDRPKR